MAGEFSQYPWYQGQTQPGVDVHNSPQVMTGQVAFQKGRWSFPPPVTAPGTVASGGTVANSTGYDCLVYLTSSAGASVKVLSYNGPNATTWTLPGTVGAGALVPVYVPGPGGIAVTYASGTINWTWMPL